MVIERAAVFHGYGSTPSRIRWLSDVLRGLGIEVEVPKLPQPLVKAYEYVTSLNLDVDLFAGHSMGGALALVMAAERDKPAVAVAPPTNIRFQLDYMKKNPDLRKIYEEITKVVEEEEMEALSPLNFKYEKPVLIIHGTNDRVVPIEQNKEFCKRVSSCKLVEIEGMGHSPRGEDERRKVRAIIEEFVKALMSN